MYIYTPYIILEKEKKSIKDFVQVNTICLLNEKQRLYNLEFPFVEMNGFRCFGHLILILSP